MSNIYSINVMDAENNQISMSNYKGKVLLIVNTATGCGFTPQYDGLQDLYEEYSDRGFEILDFPCNQFGNQAPGDASEIHDFCSSRYGITFKQFAKIDVNGDNESLLFTYLKSAKKGVLNNNIKWNFTKFLVNKDGIVVGRYSPTEKPEKIRLDIEKLL